jgi:hypothetical protein
MHFTERSGYLAKIVATIGGGGGVVLGRETKEEKRW